MSHVYEATFRCEAEDGSASWDDPANPVRIEAADREDAENQAIELAEEWFTVEPKDARADRVFVELTGDDDTNERIDVKPDGDVSIW